MADMNSDDNQPGPRTVITISGIPHDADPVRLMRVIDDVAEVACEKMQRVEIGMVSGAPDNTLDGILSPEDIRRIREESEYEGTNFHLLMKAQVAGELIIGASCMAEERHADNEWESKSEEEKNAIIEHNRERSAEWSRKAVQEMQAERTVEIRQVFDIANTWATEPELTPMERCHGVAHDIYKIYGVDAKSITFDDKPFIPDSMQKAYPINAGQAYAQHYESQLSEQIKARSIRAAKDLFGEGR
jgi:hypothetical protein